MNDTEFKTKNVWEEADENLKKDIMSFSEGYKKFLKTGVTERRCVKYAKELAESAGFKPADKMSDLKPGDKVYFENKGKNIFLAVIGKEKISAGCNIVAAHIDSPRLDLKQIPLYEDGGSAFFKTHYYGGIKKYQWTTIPLAISGVFVTKNGVLDVDLSSDDCVFCITDLLPHLASSQMKKSASEIVEGEQLSILIGSIPLKDDDKSSVKENILKILCEKYGVCEEDFISAELEAYPAFAPTDVGLDRSIVGGYGQDDRICAYPALRGLLDMKEIPEKTSVCFLADKEEIGSMGNTGMQSKFFENTFAELIAMQEDYNDLKLRRLLSASVCLSADVSAAFDPIYPNVHEKNNTPYMGRGIAVAKYTGARGKSGSNDASAELMYKIRMLFNDNDVIWQTGELGKVDEGGGGTVAQFAANLNIETIDCGVAILSMHSPFETASKADIYMAYKAYGAFYGMK